MNSKLNNFDRQLENGYLYHIALLRALAILGVMFAHVNGFVNLAFGTEKIIFNLHPPIIVGRHGVTLFFLISAYTLCRSFFSRLSESNRVCKYFIRRFFRIAPAYYVVLIAVFLFFGTAIRGYYEPGNDLLTIKSLLLHFSFINNLLPSDINNFLGVEWSTSTEFLFYFILPFLFISLLRMRRLPYIIFGTVFIYLCSLLGYYLTFFGGAYIFSYYNTAYPHLFPVWASFFISTHLHTFFLGIFSWILLDHIKLPNKFKVCIQKSTSLILIGLILVYVAAGYLEHFLNSNRVVVFLSLIFWSFFSFSLLVVFSCAKFKKNNFFSRIGDLSFSLYLVHLPVFYYVTKYFSFLDLTPYFALNVLLFITICLSITYLLSSLLFKYIEKPGVELGRSLTSKFN